VQGPEGGAAPDAEEILSFWFSDRVRARWFHSTRELDAEIHERFESLWHRATAGELDEWSGTARGALALAILLDQLPLNMYRNRPESFATEEKARTVANAAIERGFDRQLQPDEQAFLYMPFMHSENPADQARSVELFSRPGLEHNRRWAQHHRDIVARFGRFPHRNAILGRESTPEEQAWLESDDAYRG
jgi:uncharacterized protein (DUF924 family)